MAIVTKSIEVPASEDRKRKDTGAVIPGYPAYTYQEVASYEGEPKNLVVEVLNTYFKGAIKDFNEFLVTSLNRKLRIDGRPGASAFDKLVAKLANERGLTVEQVKAALATISK